MIFSPVHWLWQDESGAKRESSKWQNLSCYKCTVILSDPLRLISNRHQARVPTIIIMWYKARSTQCVNKSSWKNSGAWIESLEDCQSGKNRVLPNYIMSKPKGPPSHHKVIGSWYDIIRHKHQVATSLLLRIEPLLFEQKIMCLAWKCS